MSASVLLLVGRLLWFREGISAERGISGLSGPDPLAWILFLIWVFSTLGCGILLVRWFIRPSEKLIQFLLVNSRKQAKPWLWKWKKSGWSWKKRSA